MSVINDLKKLFFGASSVAKHTMEKATEAGKETGKKIAEQTEEYLEIASKKVEEISAQINERTGGTLEKAKNISEEVGSEVLKKAGEFWEKTKSFSEEVGEKVIEKSKQVKEQFDDYREKAIEKTESAKTKASYTMNATAETADDVASEIFKDAATTTETVKSTLADKAKAALDKGNSIFDDLMEKAEDLTEKLKAKVGDDTPAEPKIGYDNVKGSLLDGKDDFFTRAERFAKGDYHNKGDKDITKVGGIEISQDPNYEKPDNKGMVKGFEDLDGDGDEMIDEAEVVK